jgi:hypothetical protein
MEKSTPRKVRERALLDFHRLTTIPLQNKLVIPVEVLAQRHGASREMQAIGKSPKRIKVESKLNGCE